MRNLYDIVYGLLNNKQFEGLENRITKVEFEVVVHEIEISNNFFYINFSGDTITEDKFVNVLEDLLIFYCIPRTELSKAIDLYNKTGILRHITNLKDAAKKLFIKSYKRFGAQLGEPGELIMYVIMEYFIQAPQIVSKMFYKQSSDMPVFGADGLNIGFDSKSKNLIIYFCESKMYAELNDSLTKIKTSIENFLEIKNGTNQRERELKIINDFIEVGNVEEKDYILSYLDPYSTNSNNVKEVYSCMTIFNSDIYAKMKGKSNEEILDLFRKEYEVLATNAINSFVSKIRDSSIKNLSFNFIVLPVDSVNNIREKFFSKLGIEVNYD